MKNIILKINLLIHVWRLVPGASAPASARKQPAPAGSAGRSAKPAGAGRKKQQ